MIKLRCLRVLTLGLLVLAGAGPVTAEQRSVMTISGGVSLGVYEAGLGWAMTELLRQGGLESDGAPLTAVTGASAGSINALVAAIHYCAADTARNSAVANLFRDVWMPIDLEALLPERTATYDALPGFRDGVLSRAPLQLAIERILAALAATDFREGCNVRLGLVLTRNRAERFQVEDIDVRSQRFLVPLEARVRRGRLVFRNFVDFAQRDQTPHLLLHADADGVVAPAEVIRAALASSAFPIAFGRVRLNHCAQQPGSAASALCPAGYAAASTAFVDGGVFDNVPLGAAMQLGEAEAPARPDLRYEYIYIDPDFRRAAQAADGVQRPQPLETVIPDTDHYGLLDQTAFVLDALIVAHRNELYSTLRSNEWDGDRSILLVNRYAPLTADFLRHFGAFVDPVFRRFDYYVGLYDGVLNTARQLCQRRQAERPGTCLAATAEQGFRRLQLAGDPAAVTLFLALARHEFCGGRACLGTEWVWVERLPLPGDPVLGQIFLLLVPPAEGAAGTGNAVLTAPPFTEFLVRLRPLREVFTQPLREMIDHPERWYHAYLRRSALRLKALEEEKQAALSPAEQAANLPFVILTSLINFGAHTLAPPQANEAWPVSTAPPGYAWFLPDEIAIDGSQTGGVFTWRGYLAPVAGPLYLEWELAPLHWVRDRSDRANFIHGALNLRWQQNFYALSSLGVGAGVFFNWIPRDDLDNQGLLFNLSAGLLADKLRLGLGYKIIDEDTGDERLLFTIGVTDLKGWLYWF